MAFELQMLVLVTFLLMFGWVPGFVCKFRTYGLGWMLSNRSTAGLPPLPEWGQRAERAYDNLQANYPGFAVAVLLLALTGGFSPGTSLAAAVFAAARLVHMPAYTLGVVWLRVLSWALGFAASLNLLVTAVLGLVKI